MTDIQLISGAGGGGGCFLGHTLIRTPQGLRPIETLDRGDQVLSFDDQGQLHTATILKVHVHEGERVVRYRLWGGAELDATPNHWVLNQFNAFVEIGTLGDDDCLVDENGHLRPIVGRTDQGTGTVYNLTVEGHHTFIAGGIRVHNAGLGLGIAGSGGFGGGGKGGGGGTRTPTEAADDLNSSATVEVIDLLGEGEIEGFATPSKAGLARDSADWNRAMLKDIYLNNTPILRQGASNSAPADGDYNFKNVGIEVRYGTQAQQPINSNTGSGASANEVAVGVVVEKNVPVTRTITDVNVDAARVTISFPQFQQFTDQGDIVGTSVQLQIAVQYNGGGFTTVITDTVTGRSGDQYQRDYMVNLSGAFPVDIRVTRVTDDSNSTKLINAFTWTSYTEIVAKKFRYPNSALVGMRVNAEQFSSIPTRSFRVRGLKVQIPSNANVDLATGRLVYSGVWNGTFGAAQWTSDPCWCLWNLLTSKRFGFGDHITAASLDKWAFYSASQYCNELVPTGFGGTEPRFSLNCNIQTAEEAHKLINDLCSVFRAMPYWGTGALTVAQDKPTDPTYLFTSANVTEEGFSYSGSDSKTRPTVAVVSYLDLTTREIAYEVVEDAAAMAKYGVVTSEIAAFACTSRGQAARLGEWLLYSNQYETEVLSFTASVDAGVLVRPGQVIEVADPARGGARRGGRVASATTNTITVDNPVDLPDNGGTISVILKDGSLEARPVVTRVGSTLTVSPAFSSAPGINSLWVYSGGGIQATLWRVLTVQEQDGARYSVTALSYNPSKYDFIERDRPLQFRDATNLNLIPAAPTRLSLAEALYTYQAEVRAKVIITWRQVRGVNQYRVRWRKASGNWNTHTTQSPDHEILNITPGLFEVEVFSLNSVGQISTTALTGSINALGKTAPPSNVSGMTYAIDSDLGVSLSWSPVSDLDIKDYEIRRGGTDWGSATLLAYVKTTRYVLGLIDPSVTRYWVKARDTSNVVSQSAASTTVVITAPGAPTVTHAIQDPLAIISWTTPSGSYRPDYYDLRYGNTFAGGVGVTRVYGNSFSVPVTWSGSRTFWVAGVDPAGNTGTAGSRVITISAAPAPTVSAAFAGSSCTLSWTRVDGSLQTFFYEIRYGASWETGTKVTKIGADGTGYSLTVTWSGSRTFWVAAIDANGNYGAAGSVVATVGLSPAPSLSNTFSGPNAQLSWQPVKGTLETAFYEIRRGSAFASATVQGKVNSNLFTTKVDWTGTAKFWVVPVDTNGGYGESASIDVTLPAPSQPSIAVQVVDNNVLFRWQDCTTVLPVDAYELRRGSNWASATVIGTKSGLFTSVFETTSGSFTYWIAAIDSSGTYGAPGSVLAVVSQPPDYVLQLDQNSNFSGTKVNAVQESATLLLAVNTTETVEQHFTSRGWTSPQDQINAGYSFWLLPSATSGSYEEIIDYGAVVGGTRVSQTLTSTAATGSMVATPKISVKKLATDAWTDYPDVDQVYASDFQYIKFRYDFNSAGNDDLLLVTSLNYRMDLKLKKDFGSGTSSASDVGGTTVNFNLSFIDVQSITVTPSGTAARVAIYDFVDTPGPTSFKVLLFDTNGNRVSGGFSWSAQGV
jgi:predicted phage tail protein